MKNILAFLTILLLCQLAANSQNMYDIKNPGDKYSKKCERCLQMLRVKPPEVQMGLQADDQGSIFFYITDKDWFEQFFAKSGDGIAVDVVAKEMYDCNNEPGKRNGAYKGKLLEPVYLKDMKDNMQSSMDGGLLVKVGKIPYKYRESEVEFNLVLLNDKYYCYYNSFFDIERSYWDLLEMGMFMDTLTYKSRFDRELTEGEKYILRTKRMKFEIPFEKNKAEYSQEDIKPLYDSLNLTDFNITDISIRAYSSIEGSEVRNVELQQSRAQSIVKALQSYQKPTINTHVQASENWVEFLNDIMLTKYSNLASLSKTEIKEKLKDRKISADLEDILSKHRKAIIILNLQKKDKYAEIEPGALLKIFEKSLEEKNLEQAIEIQNSIFDRIKDEKIPSNYTDKLEIPEKAEFGLLLHKNTIFNYYNNRFDVYNTLLKLQKLEDLLPEDGHIKYNICALKFKAWILGDQFIDADEFLNEINRLPSYGIDRNLVKRMVINHHIVMCDYYMYNKNYKEKDNILRRIYSSYRGILETDEDILNLAQYFVAYAKYDWAIELLQPHMQKVDIDEDLLFYYINLTIIDEKLTKDSKYRSIMLNAININKERFCGLFNSIYNGGISFQLLDNDYLRSSYCENCQDTE